MQFIDLQAQYQHLKIKIDKRIQTVLDHGGFIMGPEVQELEQKLADYVGVKYAISCANGTDALQLALMAMEVKAGDAVFCPTFTFFASAEAPALMGATPVFVDSDPSTFNICTVDLEKRIQHTIDEGKLTPKVIIAVDLFGLPANYLKLEELAKKYGLLLLEDAAQGFGGSINNKKAGSFGDIATTSFFPAKPLGCYGDGGAIFTNNDQYAELIRSYRVHGKGQDKYDNVRIGINSRLDTIQAAILLEKLAVFPDELVQRNAAAAFYSQLLGETFATPKVPDGFISAWAQYTIVDDNRDKWMSVLKDKNIPSVIYYGKCMHHQTAFAEMSKGVSLPVAESLAKRVFSLPMHAYLNANGAQHQIMTALLTNNSN